jgi:hypothetical protein
MMNRVDQYKVQKGLTGLSDFLTLQVTLILHGEKKKRKYYL